MSKRALCIGINDYPYKDMDLKGCVNDAFAWAELLTEHFDFPRSNVKILTNAEATKKRVMAALKAMLAKARAGDVLVFTNSSHGTYLPDRDGDEDRYDEAICPYDVEDNVVVDDELRELFADLPQGVKLTVIADSCYSGTVTRIIVPKDRRRRFLNPSLRGVRELHDSIRAKPNRYQKYPESMMKELLISACSDIEYSYEANIGNCHHGALTYFALEAIRNANYQISYAELIKYVRKKMTEFGFPQHPQLEGKAEYKNQQMFV